MQLQLKKLCLRSLMAILPVFSAGTAQALQAVATKNLFYAPSGKSFRPYLELYWQVDPHSILFKKENGVWQGNIRTDILITDSAGKITEEHFILATKPVTEGTQLYAQNILDLRRFELKEGKNIIELRLSDEYKKESIYIFKDSITVERLVDMPRLSDVQLVDTAIVSDKEDIFQRNGRLQIPLCTNFFDEQRKNIHYYAEVYQPTAPSGDTLLCRTYISKKELEYPLNRLLITDTLPPGHAVHIIDSNLSLRTLPSGNYFLNIVLENLSSQRITASTLFFQVLNAHPDKVEEAAKDSAAVAGDQPDVYLNLNKTFLGKYTPEQIRAILKMLLPVADPTEKVNINGFIKKPDDTYSRYFIYNFWLKRNKLKPEESWKEYADRVKQANKLFGSSLLSGYESERGIIYLKYGEPTERIVVNNESNALPYEVWQYNTLPNASNALFLFYRPGLVTNDYRLLHSTVNGELRNRNWRASLFVGGSSADANSSRAEQYIGNR